MSITLNDSPDLLKDDSLDNINEILMHNNHTFVFLGPKESFLNRVPSSWIEAFEMYTTGLYKVYHEYGMEFLMCYCYEAIGHDDKNWALFWHFQFVQNCRGALQHSSDLYRCREFAFNTIKNYIFRDSYFTFRDWSDFWKNAKDDQWQKVTEVIVRDSNKLLTFLKRIKLSSTTCKSIGDSVFNDFVNKSFNTYKKSGKTVSKGYPVNMYEKSFNARFFRIVSCSLINMRKFEDSEKEKAELEFRILKQDSPKDERTAIEISNGVKTPQEIKTAIIDIVINDLKSSDESVPWNPIFDYILSIIEEQIKNQLTAKTRAEMMETLVL